MSFDRRDFCDVKLDTPIAPPADMLQRYKLAPGTCVKERGIADFLDTWCGIVNQHEHGEDCVVIGHGWNDTEQEMFVWRGTIHEFNRTWTGD